MLAYGRTAGSNPSLSTASLPTSPEAGTSHQYMTTLGYTSEADANIAEVRTTRVLALIIVDLVDSHGRWKRPCLQTTPNATGGAITIPYYAAQCYSRLDTPACS